MTNADWPFHTSRLRTPSSNIRTAAIRTLKDLTSTPGVSAEGSKRISRSISSARPSVVDSLYGECFEIFTHPLRSRLYICNDRSYGLLKGDIIRWAGAL